MTIPTTSTAIARNGAIVRVATNLRCPDPKCGAILRACDFICDSASIAAMCSACHRDALTVEMKCAG